MSQEVTGVQTDYDVQMPRENMVYYDTVLDRTIDMRDVDQEEDLVVFYHDTPESMQSVPLREFLASLASGRYVALGDRTDRDSVITSHHKLVRAFRTVYNLDPREVDAVEVAKTVLQSDSDERLAIEK